MRIVKISAAVLALSLICLASAAAGEKAWFDMENCAFCKNLAAQEGLMDNITKWEHHKVKNGAISITEVNKDYLPAYKTAMAGMEATSKKIQGGETLPMCGMCEAYGALTMKGVQWEEVGSDNVFVMLMHSDDPEVVKEIHAITDRTNDEIKKMEAVEKTEGSEGDDQ
ncbi:MAG: hypothetical protein JSW64_05865 [Candidatus Zixiibacteriota bacterium]|nr:MAG: hypothetical protein JSW64_05865 [candidate division Zixibacteria bacterium]